MKNFTLFLTISLFLSICVFAQPAGVGNSTDNVLWLKADDLNLLNGQKVTSWSDASGNSNDAGQSNASYQPVYTTNAINGQPALDFNGSQYLIIGQPANLDFTPGTDEFTIFAVFNAEGNGSIIAKGYSDAGQRQYQCYVYTGGRIYTRMGGTDSHGSSDVTNNNHLASYSVSATDINAWVDGTLEINNGGVGTATNSVDVIVGGRRNASDNTGSGFRFNGYIAEVIVYNRKLSDSERYIIENYLAEKYTVDLNANDFFDETAASGYSTDVIGIGNDGTDSHTVSTTSGGGLYLEEDNSSLGTDEYLFAGHDGTEHGVTNNNVNDAANCGRWERSWYIDKTGTLDAVLKFDLVEAGFNAPTDVNDYKLLYRSSTSNEFAEVTATASLSGNKVVFSVADANLTDGFYTLGVPEGKIWYSMITGDWDNTATWTLDPAGALWDNPGYTPSTSPTAAYDKVYILSGREVTISANNKANSFLRVEGRLKLGTTTGHSFVTIQGGGQIVLEADNFPSGNPWHFITEGQGEGTVVFRGNSYTINNDYSFYDVLVDLDAPANVLTCKGDLSLNGNLYVENGIFKINDNSSTDVVNISINKNLEIESNGQIQTGTADVYSANNQYHQFIIQGDFINNGTAKFTNRSAADYENNDDTGAAEVIFNHPKQNQTVQCNATTVFNQLTVNKGSDQSYIVDISANSTANFKLYGRNNQEISGDIGDRDAANGGKALRLLAGTAKLGANIEIPVLAKDYSYDIDQDARLWLNGAIVTIPEGVTNNWVAIYGKLQLSGSSVFTEETNFGTILRRQGTIYTEDNATVNIACMRTSTWDASGDHIGAYIQTGGTVNITDEGSNGDYASFHLPYETNIFQMSDGELYIKDQGNSGDADDFTLIINSTTGNYSVTGGTVYIDMEENQPYKMTSRAPFWNFVVRNSVDSDQTLSINDFDEDSGGDIPDVEALPLVVLGDFTIEDNCTFVTNGQDVKIGHNFNLNDGGTYTHGNNTTWFTGSDRAYINVGNTTNAGELQLYNVTLYKDQRYNTSLFHRVEVRSGGRSSDVHPVEILGDLYIRRGEFDVNEWEVDVKGNIEIVDGQILSSETSKPEGWIVLNGTTQQTIKGAVGAEQAFGNFELDNTNGAKLLSDINAGNFILSQGVMDLDLYNLDVSGSLSTTGTYNGSLIYKTAGNASDGGLTLYIDLSKGVAGTEYLFPIGTGTEYNPAKVIQAATIADAGKININPVSQDHPASTVPSKTIPYYWVVDVDGFSIVTKDDLKYSFTYSGTIPGSASKLLTQWSEDFQWYEYNKNISSGEIRFPYEAYLEGDYTVGNHSDFKDPIIYYSTTKSRGNDTDFGTNDKWTNPACWSTVGHYSDVNDGSYPQDGDVAILGFGLDNATDVTDNNQRSHWFFVDADVKVARLIFAEEVVNADGISVPRSTSFHPQLVIKNDASLDVDLGVVSGTGTFNVRVGCTSCNADPLVSVPVVANITADFGDFANSELSRFDYDLFTSNNSAVYLPQTFPDVYPNLNIKGQNGSNRVLIFNEAILIKRDLTIRENAVLRLSNQANGDMEVLRNLNFTTNSGNDVLQFPTSGTERTFTLHGDILMDDGNDVIEVLNTSPSGLEHRFRLGGSIDKKSGNTIDFFTDNAGGNNVILEIIGETDEVYQTDDNPADFYRIIMNKREGISFDFDHAFTLNGPTDGDEKALELISGDLLLQDAGIDITLTSGGADFKIPKETSLITRGPTIRVSGNNTGIWLDGVMHIGWSAEWYINEGTNNYIEYTASGNSEIQIYQGTLEVGSQIRRDFDADDGILSFRHEHSNSTVIIGTDADTDADNRRGVFEILNAGSYFKQVAGAQITIANAQPNGEIAALYLDPGTSDVEDGSGFVIGGSETNSSNQNFEVYSNIEIGGLHVDNSGGKASTAVIKTIPLHIRDELLIDAGAEFNANGLDLFVGGDFTNNGTFTHNENTTYLDGTTAQTITGNTTFYKLYRTEAGTATLNDPITVENHLELSDGIFADGGNTVTVYGSVVCNANHDYGDAGLGIYFNGTEQQTLEGVGTLGKLTVNNLNGVLMPTVGYAINIDDAVELQSGVLDIGKNLLVLDQDAAFIETNPFGNKNMVQTNISFTDNGIKKIFPAISSTETFLYPLGSEGKYTPIELSLDQMNAGGSIRVKAANEIEPTVTDDAEDCTEFVDQDNVLQYHWVMKSENVTGFTGSATMTYDGSDEAVTAPNTLANYITACLLHVTDTWNKYDYDGVDEDNNQLIFDFTGVDSDGISGDYTAGFEDLAETNCGAIPDVVPTYISVTDGDWNNAATWDTYPVGGGYVPTGGPTGAIVIIEHEVSLANNYRSNYKTSINGPNGVLNTGSTYGHRMGIVDGTGELKTETGTLPAGDYDDFIKPGTGTFHFAGTGDYEVLGEMPLVNSLRFSGSGSRSFPNLDMIVNGDISIEGTVALNNDYNKTIEIKGDFNLEGGSFDAGTGNDAVIIFNGTSAQSIGGATGFTGGSAFNHLEIANAAGVTLDAPVDVDNNLTFTNGILATDATNILTLENTATNIISGAGSGSYVDGPLRKNMNNGDDFTFPTGNSGRYGELILSNVNTGGGTQYWTVAYNGATNSNTDSYSSPIEAVSENEHWEINGNSGSIADITLRWDNFSDISPNLSDVSKLLVSQYITSSWEDAGNTANGGTATDGWITSNTITFTGNGTEYFTLASEDAFIRWDGSASTNWNTAANWSNNKVPDGDDIVIIPTGLTNYPAMTSGGDMAIHNITIEAGASLTIPQEKTLTVNGFLKNDGQLILEEHASLLDAGNVSGTGNTTAKLSISKNIYHYISSPVKNVSTSIVGANGGFYYWDATQAGVTSNYNTAWQNAGGNFETAKGYALNYRASGTKELNFSGDLTNTGTIEVPLTYQPDDPQWEHYRHTHLVGNPYPSGIDVDEFFDENADLADPLIEGFVWFWDGTDYATINGSGEIAGASGKVPERVIHSCQGFSINNKFGAGNLRFTNAMRISNSTQFFKKKRRYVQSLRLSITYKNEHYNETLIAFTEKATRGHDNLFDSPKQFGNSNIALFSLGQDNDYSIQSYPLITDKDTNNVEIPIGYRAGSAGMYVITAKEIKHLNHLEHIYLEDIYENKIVDLKKAGVYEFKTNEGEFKGRFRIIFATEKKETISDDEIVTQQEENTEPENNQDVTSTPDNNNEVGQALSIANQADNDIFIYSHKRDIYIKMEQFPLERVKVFIYDINGKKIEEKYVASKFVKISTSFPKGYYFVKALTKYGVVTKKLFIE